MLLLVHIITAHIFYGGMSVALKVATELLQSPQKLNSPFIRSNPSDFRIIYNSRREKKNLYELVRCIFSPYSN